MRIRVFLSIALSCWSASSLLAADRPEQEAFFESKIRPVLVNHCYECHSAASKEVGGGLLLDTREGIRRGGESGHAVVPGELDDSLILDALRYESIEMPPEEPLPDRVIADFGIAAVEKKMHVHDLHATTLHLLGLDHTKLTYRYAGRDFRLTDVYGRVAEEIIA